jgi:GntR family transcriptional regulator, vanillate catabolism transcriptional regulator
VVGSHFHVCSPSDGVGPRSRAAEIRENSIKTKAYAGAALADEPSHRSFIDNWDPKGNTPCAHSDPKKMNRHQTRALVRIREMILRGELRAGARVAEAPLAELLGMSRTPVRQALPVLAQEGLLGQHETRGYVVRGLSTADILDAIDLRGVLEGIAARRVAEHGASRTLLEALRVCLAEGDHILAEGHVADKVEALYVDMNVRFHQLIVLDCRSGIIQQALERNARIPFAGPQALAFDKTSLQGMHDTLSYAHRQHHNIVTAIERGEGSRVEALMREHTNPVKENLNIAGVGELRDTKPHLALVK